MRPNVLPLLALIGLAVSAVHAQTGGDASDLFLNAFMSFQKGEKADATGDSKGAIRSYNAAINTLDAIARRWPTWNPPIVKYRRERATEALGKLQAAAGAGGSVQDRPDGDILNGPAVPDNGDVLPPDKFPSETPEKKGSSKKGSGAVAGGDLIAGVQSLKDELEATRSKLARASDEKAELTDKLKKALKAAEESAKQQEILQGRATRAEQTLSEAEKSGAKSAEELMVMRAELAKTRKQMRELQFERDAETEFREQINSRMSAASRKIDSLSADRDAARKESANVPKQLAEMQKQIEAVNREKGELESKLAKVEQQLQEVTGQRDDAMQQLVKMREAQKDVAKMVADNTDLMTKLADAENQIATFKTDGVKKDDEIKRLNTEVTSVRKQLAEAQQQSAQNQIQMTDLRKQLESQARDLAQMKTDATKSAADQKRLVEENSLLRGVVLRQQKEQANREQVKKLVLNQLTKLEINSKALTNQIELLGSPVVKLTEKEKKLFKEPVLSINDAEITFGSPKESNAEPAPAPVAEGQGEAVTAATSPTPSDGVSLARESTPSPLPDEMPALTVDPGAGKGKSQLDLASNKQSPGLPTRKSNTSMEGELPVKEAANQKPETVPTPGVKTGTDPAVPADLIGLARDAKDQFERGNYRDAEKVYEKALAKAPNNLYILSNLGVVRFRSGKFKLAEESFKKAIAIAPEDDFSHCTLGIVFYSQNKFDDAINELTKALALNPKNATAHNYLGITASQKGWQEAAQKELETATALDPNYADAHFNLAVVFATQTPVNKEGARQHYKRATELGAEPDSALEQLIK